MQVVINESGKMESLDYIVDDIDISADFIGNTGALGREFVVDIKTGEWRCDKETYQWWRDIIDMYKVMDAHCLAFRIVFADKIDEINDFIAEIAANISDIESIPAAVIAALDERYGDAM